MVYEVILVDTPALLRKCLADIGPSRRDTKQPSLSVDLEGVDLCRHGRIAIIQILREISNIVWLIDVTVMDSAAFDTQDEGGNFTLRDILENPDQKKV